ncbi:MAG: thioredoxin [Alphaproteobacteria bacterium]|jgi:thioredoxin 1|nr:thioredoxin [Candidatus Jidaibacter sp.]
MAIYKVSDENFANEVLNHAGVTIVDFWAEWCGPCRQLGPILEDFASENIASIKVCKMNVDENPETPSKYGIRSIPTLIMFKDGKQVATKVGVLQKSALMEWLKSQA